MRLIVYCMAVAGLLAIGAGPASSASSAGTPSPKDAVTAAQMKVDDAHAAVTSIEAEIRKATGRYDVSPDGLNKAIDKLQQQQEQLELDEAGAVGRQRATEEAVARFTEEAKKRLDAGDPVVSELEKVVALREKQLARMQALMQNGAVSVESMDAAETALGQAKAEVAAARKNAAGGSGITEALSAWNREAMNLSIERAERSAKLDYIKDRIDRLRSGAGLLDKLDRAIQNENEAANQLMKAKLIANNRNNLFPTPADPSAAPPP